MEEALRSSDVLHDLLTQKFRRVKASLRTYVFEEGEFERSFRAESNGMEIQEVRLDGKGVGAEGGAIANVCNRLEEFGIDP